MSGNVDLFTASGEIMTNVVVCSHTLDVSALYVDSSSAALQFYEPSGHPGDISGNVNSAFRSDGELQVMYRLFGADMQAVVADAMDASGAAPFNTYNGLAKVQRFNSLGDLVLSLYAHYIFGHAAATAAIDNDTNLVNYVNRSAAASGADVGLRLAEALSTLSADVASAIVGQIAAQDPSRTRQHGNNQDQAQGVIFAAGDVVFVRITVEKPSITVGPTGAATGAPGDNTNTNLVGSAFPTERPFVTLQVTLA